MASRRQVRVSDVESQSPNSSVFVLPQLNTPSNKKKYQKTAKQKSIRIARFWATTILVVLGLTFHVLFAGTRNSYVYDPEVNYVIGSRDSETPRRAMSDDGEALNTVTHRSFKMPDKTCVITISTLGNFGFVWSLYKTTMQNSPSINCFIWYVGDKVNPTDHKAVRSYNEIQKKIKDDFTDFTMVTLDDMDKALPLFQPKKLAFTYTKEKLHDMMLPFAFQYTFNELKVDAAVFLNHRIWVTDSLSYIQYHLAEKCIVVTPNFLDPSSREKMRADDPHVSGIHDTNFAALSNNSRSLEFLEWWTRKASLKGLNDIEGINDDSWTKHVSVFFSHLETVILQDNWYNVAYWNHEERGVGLHLKEDGFPYVKNSQTNDAERVVFMNFNGMKFEEVERDTNAAIPASFDNVFDIFKGSLEDCKVWYYLRTLPYSYDHFSDGMKVENWMRYLYASVLYEGFDIDGNPPPYAGVISPYSRDDYKNHVASDPFCSSEECMDDPSKITFIRWMLGITPGKAIDMDGAFFFSFPQWRIWYEHPDLQEKFPDPTGDDYFSFTRWFRNDSVKEKMIDNRLKNRWKDVVSEHAYDNASFHDSTGSNGLNIIGWFDDGSTASQLVRSAIAVQTPVNAIQLNPTPNHPYTPSERLDFNLSRSCSHSINLISVNPDQFNVFLSEFPANIRNYKYNVAYWDSDVAAIDLNWREIFGYLDEIWCPSTQIMKSIKKVSGYDGTTIRVLPPPVKVIDEASLTIDNTQLKDLYNSEGGPKPFAFFMSSNLNKVHKMRVVEGIKSFMKAFPLTEEKEKRHQLIIDSYNGSEEEFEDLNKLVNGDQRIVFLHERLSDAEKQSLIKYQDCYISLHSSHANEIEMLSTLNEGIPVIAVEHSVNNEYFHAMPELDISCTHSVPFKVIEVEEDGTGVVSPDYDILVSSMINVSKNDCKKNHGKDISEEINKQFGSDVFGSRLKRLMNISKEKRMVKDDQVYTSLKRSLGHAEKLPKGELVHKTSTLTLSLVISHCESSLQWIPKYINKYFHIQDITIYSKCGKRVEGIDLLQSATPPKVIVHENVGSADHSYAHWIKEHYASIANDEGEDGDNIVVFLKDNNEDADSYVPFNELFTYATKTGFGCGIRSTSFCDCREGVKQCKDNESLMLHDKSKLDLFAVEESDSFDNNFMSADYPNLKTWKDSMGLVTAGSGMVPVCYDNMFAVQRKQIVNQSEETWKKIEKSLSRGNEIVESHYAERMWAPSLCEQDDDLAKFVDKVVTPHISETSLCSWRQGMILVPKKNNILQYRTKTS